MQCTQTQCNVHKLSAVYTNSMQCTQTECSVQKLSSVYTNFSASYRSQVQLSTSHDESVGNGEAEVAVDVVKAAGH